MQEYVANKTKKTEERRKAIEDINAVIQQIYKDQDLTQGICFLSESILKFRYKMMYILFPFLYNYYKDAIEC